MYIYYIYDRACIMDASWAMEPQLPLLDELLRLLVDVVSFRTREAVGDGDKVVDLDLGHLLHRHLPGRTSTGAGRRRRSNVLAPTNHLLLLLDQMLLRLPDRSARWD